MTISEKVAYIQGLYDGLGLDSRSSGEARILFELLDALKEVGIQMDNLDASVDQFDRELDALEDSVADLENAVFAGESGEDDQEDGEDAIRARDDLGENFFEIPCPTCGEALLVDDEAMAAGVVDCPNCGGRFALSFEEDEEDDE